MANRFSASRMGDASAAITTAKTMLRVAAGTGDPITIIGWWIEFDSVASSDKPIKVELLKETAVAAGTSSSVTPVAMGPTGEVGTTATTVGANFTVEGAPTLVTLEQHYIPATGGVYIQYPLGREHRIDGALAFRIRITAVTTAVNATYGAMWEE